MARNILALSMLAVIALIAFEATAAPEKAIRRERPGFIFLGSTKKEVTVTINGISTTTLRDWSYWISVNSAGHADAIKDCQGNGYRLLEIEDEAKLAEVEEFLRDTDQTASSFWVGAKFQVSSGTFVWSSTGTPVLDSMWAAGQPSQKNPNSRVGLDGQIVQLKSQAGTQATRYICEGV